MITAVHHVSFTVSDMEQSLDFYRGALGFEVLNDRTVEGSFAETVTTLEGVRMRIVHLSGYGQGLELIQYLAAAGQPEAPRTCDTGSAHLCYVVDDIDAEIARLSALGVRFLSKVMMVEGGPNAGNRMVYFLDPDGIPMEFTQPAGGG
ncbi:MAG: VOC family protein [Planctomycetota bacterium]|nr:VOC family protein [Planctomycetota bacterium]MEE3298315.1 VOC family protein [Planctomycetota bacterium]